MKAEQSKTLRSAFTLLEISVVLVIIGLIIGGVLVGQDIIRSANVQATITQLEKYNSAANTFKEKYGALPGDIADPGASSYGFAVRGTCAGQGDGNGLIEGYYNNGCYSRGADQAGETLMFWEDLSKAKLISNGFSVATSTTQPTVSFTTNPTVDAYLPVAKLGMSQYFYVYSNVLINYFGIVGVTSLGPGAAMGKVYTLPVAVAANWDQKTDDGLPLSGNVIAGFAQGGGQYWMMGGYVTTNNKITAATPGSTTTCFDNSSAASGTPGIANATSHYSMEISSGSNANCALSFRMQ